MSDYCIDHLTLTPMTIGELRRHVFECHEIGYDLKQICDYKCTRCEEYFLCFVDAYAHKKTHKKKGHEIEKCSSIEDEDVKNFLYIKFENEMGRCKRARMEVEKELEELKKKEDEIIERAKYLCNGEDIPTTSTPKEPRISGYEQKFLQNAATPQVAPLEEKMEVQSPSEEQNDTKITARKGTSAKKRIEEEEMELEVEEEEESEEEKGDKDDEYREPGYHMKKRLSKSPPSRTLRRSGRPVKRKVPGPVDESKEEVQETVRRTRRKMKDPEPAGPASRLRTRARSISKKRAERHQTPVEGEKGEETTPARNLRSRAQAAESVGPSPSTEDKSRLGIISITNRATSATAQPSSVVKKTPLPAVTSTPEGSQSEKKRGRPRKIVTCRENKPNITFAAVKPPTSVALPAPVATPAPVDTLPAPEIAPRPAVGSPAASTEEKPAIGPAATLSAPQAPTSIPSPIEESSLPSVAQSVEELPAPLRDLSPAAARAPSPLPSMETGDSTGIGEPEGDAPHDQGAPNPPKTPGRSTLTSPRSRDRDSRPSRSRYSRSKSPYRPDSYSRRDHTRSRERTPSYEGRDGPLRTPIGYPFHPNQYPQYSTPPPGYYPIHQQYPTEHNYGRQFSPYPQHGPHDFPRRRGSAGRPLGQPSWRPNRPSFPPPTGPSGSWVTPQNNFPGRTEQTREEAENSQEDESAEEKEAPASPPGYKLRARPATVKNQKTEDGSEDSDDDDDDYLDETIPSTTKRPPARKFSLEFKLKVVNSVKKLSKHEVARKFNVDRRSIRSWCYEKAELEARLKKEKRQSQGSF